MQEKNRTAQVTQEPEKGEAFCKRWAQRIDPARCHEEDRIRTSSKCSKKGLGATEQSV